MLKRISSIILIPFVLLTPMTLPAQNNKAIAPIIAYLLSDTVTETEPEFVIPAISEAQKQEFLAAINNARSQKQDCGGYGEKDPVPALVWNEKLYNAAYIYNYDMVYGGAWSHIGSGTEYDIVASNVSNVIKSTMIDRIRYYDYRYYTIGENIAWGYTTTNNVIAGWLASDGHCANIMNNQFTEVGMSLYRSENGTAYWTQDFGTLY